MHRPCRAALIPALGCLLAVSNAAQGRSPLGGPDVDGGAVTASLVARGFEGEVLKLDAPASIAALDLIELDERTESKLHELLADRAAVMEGIVLGNIELLSQIETVMTVGSPSEKLVIMQQGLAALKPARDWGKLRDRIASQLPQDSRETYDDLIDEYEAARFRASKAAGEVERAFEFRMMRHWEDMIWEIERAAERAFEDDGEGDEWFVRLSEKLDLTPDQEGKIRAMGERMYIETKGRPTEADELAYVNQIRTVLTVEQRWKFTAMLLRGELDESSMDE